MLHTRSCRLLVHLRSPTLSLSLCHHRIHCKQRVSRSCASLASLSSNKSGTQGTPQAGDYVRTASVRPMISLVCETSNRLCDEGRPPMGPSTFNSRYASYTLLQIHYHHDPQPVYRGLKPRFQDSSPLFRARLLDARVAVALALLRVHMSKYKIQGRDVSFCARAEGRESGTTCRRQPK